VLFAADGRSHDPGWPRSSTAPRSKSGRRAAS
jgi:hypothetical protein